MTTTTHQPSPREAARITVWMITLTVSISASALAISYETFIAPVGEAAADWHGVAAYAGDVNGDGYGDIIVGARMNDAGGDGAGRAYVYFGGPDADETPDLIFTGLAAEDGFGHSVASAGDVNGDGYDDLFVGAPGHSAAGDGAGAAYLFYGGERANTFPDLTLLGEAAGDLFGISVAPAGDVNDDGYDDLLVGSLSDAGGLDTGRAYVYYGGAAADDSADVVLVGQLPDERFGVSVASAGDMNADGYGDLIVGAFSSDANGSNVGRAYVYFGGTELDTIPSMTTSGERPGDLLGVLVAPAGDVNGDGFSDVLVGTDPFDIPDPEEGLAYLFLGGPEVDRFPDIRFVGDQPNDLFGRFGGPAGDFDGDGFDDIVIGAVYNSTAGNAAGRAYVMSIYPYRVTLPNGGETWVAGSPTTVRWRGRDLADIAYSTDAGLSWITLLSGVGGDAENEVTLIAPWTPTEAALVRLSYSGQSVAHATSDVSDDVFRIVLPVDPPAAALRRQLAPIGEAAGDEFGVSVSSAGDFDGDGFADVIVGARGSDAGAAGAGRAYVYRGGSESDEGADVTFTGEAADDAFGIAVAAMGDFNADGYDDVGVGAYQNDAGGDGAGRAYVYFGGPTADDVPDIICTGTTAGGALGNTLAPAGDVNGDGFDDLIVGAFLAASSGQATVYFGGPTADATADLVLSGENPGDGFGTSVGGAGDVNGDGHDDVVVGAALAAGGDGRAYVYHGGDSPDVDPDEVLSWEVGGGYFGYAVAIVGDVNGDGLADLLIGAPLNDVAGASAGRAYLYLGGPDIGLAPDLVFAGEAGSSLGTAVSGAGDVNGDGYDDFTIGAFQYQRGSETAVGRAFLYYGGAVPDNVADHVLTGTTSGDQFGVSVAGAGDVTGDGLPDLVVGAFGDDTAGNEAGRAYLYDINRHHVTDPRGGEVWNVGAERTISWMGSEPADVWLSANGGAGYTLLASGVGGDEANTLALRVPHLPTRFGRVKITPTDATIGGVTESDSLFTIDAAIILTMLRAAPPPDGTPGVLVRWETDPGPEDLSGYRLDRKAGSSESGGEWRAIVPLTRATSHLDLDGVPSACYRLTALNGLGEAFRLGETVPAFGAPMGARPRPYRGGQLIITFSAGDDTPGSGPTPTTVGLFDVGGRLVRWVANGAYPPGGHQVAWDGRDETGSPVAPGLYFLRSTSGGRVETLKVTVLR